MTRTINTALVCITAIILSFIIASCRTATINYYTSRGYQETVVIVPGGPSQRVWIRAAQPLEMR